MKTSRYLLACLAVPFIANCDSATSARYCTLIGCDSGVQVVLESPPSGAYRIDAYSASPGPRYTLNCQDSAHCAYVYFADFTPARISIEVTSSSGTQRYEVVLTYVEHRPNGDDCPPVCRMAVIRLPSDALGDSLP